MALVLVSGANDSGKSLFAEHLVCQMLGKRYYIATMQACTEENDRRIEKHRRQRAGLGFQTLERLFQVKDAPVDANSVVLLEDVSNLLANVLFEKGGNEEAVFQDIMRLQEQCHTLIAVTISGLESTGYDAETAAYIRALNALNQKLFDQAEVAIMMQEHLPVCQKGDIHDFIGSAADCAVDL